jgi:hypothetical protein
MRALRAKLAVALVGSVGASIGCEVLVGIHERAAATANPDAGDRDALPDVAQAEAETDAGCAHAFPPPRPTTDDGTENLAFVLATRTTDYGVHLDAGLVPFGFDLDGLCTCPDPPPCAPFKPTDMQCDLPHGIDNSMAALFQQLTDVSHGNFNLTAYGDALAQGVWGLVLQISDYNGGANDTAVTVAVFPSNGTVARDWDSGTWEVTPDAGVVAPMWDGHDVWSVDANSKDGQTAQYFDTSAYVANHTLVAHVDYPLRSASVGMYASAITTTLVAQVIAGTLVRDGNGSFHIEDGITAGRWPVRDLSNALAEFPDQLIQGAYTCPGGFTYSQVKSLVCQAADVPANPAQTDPRYVCDALSVGSAFTAYPAILGPLKPRPPTNSPCVDAAPVETCQ